MKEMSGLKQMVEDMKEMVAGLRVTDKGVETGSSVTTTGVKQDREEQAREEAAKIRTEEMITGEERTEICSGTPLMASHAYTKNQESPIGKEIDLQQWDTLIFKGEHGENEQWCLVGDRNGQVGYAPVAFVVVIVDTTEDEDESGATKKGQESSKSKTGLEDGFDRRANEGRVSQRQ